VSVIVNVYKLLSFSTQGILKCLSLRLNVQNIFLKEALNSSSCVSLFLSVRPHGTTQLPLDVFSRNLVFEYFSKICRGNSSFIKIWQA